MYSMRFSSSPMDKSELVLLWVSFSPGILLDVICVKVLKDVLVLSGISLWLLMESFLDAIKTRLLVYEVWRFYGSDEKFELVRLDVGAFL